MAPTNQAAWLVGKWQELEIKDAPYPSLEPDRVDVKNASVALNPLDHKMQDYSILIQSRPTILGKPKVALS